MFKKILKKIELLEDAMVEYAEMNAMVLSANKFFAFKTEQSLKKEKEAKKSEKAYLQNFSRAILGWN